MHNCMLFHNLVTFQKNGTYFHRNGRFHKNFITASRIKLYISTRLPCLWLQYNETIESKYYDNYGCDLECDKQGLAYSQRFVDCFNKLSISLDKYQYNMFHVYRFLKTN